MWTSFTHDERRQKKIELYKYTNTKMKLHLLQSISAWSHLTITSLSLVNAQISLYGVDFAFGTKNLNGSLYSLTIYRRSVRLLHISVSGMCVLFYTKSNSSLVYFQFCFLWSSVHWFSSAFIVLSYVFKKELNPWYAKLWRTFFEFSK